MKIVAARFQRSMDELLIWLKLIDTIPQIVSADFKKLPERNKGRAAAQRLKRTINRIPSAASIIPLEGAYLTACAEFEKAIRDLLESAAIVVEKRYRPYRTTPAHVREIHEAGCAAIMSRITWDQHSHLTRPGLTARLLECFEAATPTDPFHLVVDAFSRSERNFTSDVISEKFKGVCFQNFWPTIAGRAEVLARYGTTDRSAAQSRIKSEIDEIMQRRNRLVHRGRNAYTPSRSEVEQCAEVLAIVVSAIANECPNAIASFK